MRIHIAAGLSGQVDGVRVVDLPTKQFGTRSLMDFDQLRAITSVKVF